MPSWQSTKRLMSTRSIASTLLSLGRNIPRQTMKVRGLGWNRTRVQRLSRRQEEWRESCIPAVVLEASRQTPSARLPILAQVRQAQHRITQALEDYHNSTTRSCTGHLHLTTTHKAELIRYQIRARYLRNPRVPGRTTAIPCRGRQV